MQMDSGNLRPLKCDRCGEVLDIEDEHRKMGVHLQYVHVMGRNVVYFVIHDCMVVVHACSDRHFLSYKDLIDIQYALNNKVCSEHQRHLDDDQFHWWDRRPKDDPRAKQLQYRKREHLGRVNRKKRKKKRKKKEK